MHRRQYLISDYIMKALGMASFAVVCGIFLMIFGEILAKGIGEISFRFLLSNPISAGREGGIGPIMISTLALLIIALIVALPISVFTGAFLANVGGQFSKLSRSIQMSLDILAGTPSIVFGLFGNVLFCKVLGLGFSLFSGGLTLACMILPLMIRGIEESLRQLPKQHFITGEALGLKEQTTLFSILLPLASPSIIACVILSIGRAIAETAALIFTSGYVMRMPMTVFDSGRSLSIHIFDLSMNVPGGEEKAYASALVLIVTLLAINLLANYLLQTWHKLKTI